MFGKKIFCLCNGLQRNWIQALIAIFDTEILKFPYKAIDKIKYTYS